MPKLILTCCCLAMFVVGCAPANGPITVDQADDSNLMQVGELCRYYQVAKKKAPTKLDELSFVKSQAANGFEELRSRRIILRYGAMLPDTGEEPGQAESDEVLAYLSKVPENGGKVLMLNRAIKTMSADQFKAAKKAGKD
jgi:hypothetical protein